MGENPTQDVAKQAKPTETSCFVDLGCSGVIRLRAATLIKPRLLPNKPATIITGFKASRKALAGTLALGGEADNLNRMLKAKLTWLLKHDTGGGAGPQVPHYADVVLVPEAKTGKLAKVKFTVCEFAPKPVKPRKSAGPPEEDYTAGIDVPPDEETVPLTYDILRLGLYGTTPVGFRLEPYDPAVAPCEIDADTSGVSIDVRMKISLLDAKTGESVERGSLRVGSALAVQVEAGPAFLGESVMLELWESEDPGEEDERFVAPPIVQGRFWKIIEKRAREEFRLGVDNGFWYTRDLAGKGTLCFRCRLRLLKPNTGDKHEPLEGAKPLYEERICEAPSPQLTRWTIARGPLAPPTPGEWAPRPTVVLSGQITGLAPDFRMPLAARLWSYLETKEAENGYVILRQSGAAIGSETETTASASGQEVEGRSGQGTPAEMTEAVSNLVVGMGTAVAGGHGSGSGDPGSFSATAILSDNTQKYLRDNLDARLFAVLSIPTMQSDPPPFAMLVGYEANMKDDGKDTGFAPFGDGCLSAMNVASGVCTDLLDAPAGKHLESDAAWVPESRRDAFNMVLATIYGEAGNSSEGSWRAIAHVIMNRRNPREPLPEDVVQHGFGAYDEGKKSKESPYAVAWKYLTGQEKPAGRFARTVERILNDMAGVVAPVFMEREANNDPTGGATNYFSPICQKKKGRNRPGFASSMERVHVPILDPKDDFEFFRPWKKK